MKAIVAAVAIILLAAGCGFRFSPGYSARDPHYFAEVPIVVKKTNGDYVLRWRYGSAGFWFRPEYKVMQGALWFAMQGTTSTGDHRGQIDDMKIEGPAAIQALEAGGAYWWEPDRTTIRLEFDKDGEQGH